MALLRLHCFPSTTYFFTEQQQQQFHVASLLSLHKPQSQYKIKNLSLSWSLSNAHSFSIKAATTENPVVDSSSSSSSLDISIETTKTEQQQEDLSKTRLLAQNVPWTSTTEDIRALFEKHGTVLDVELSMHNKTKNRGLAFVTMGSPEEAVAAINNLESYEFEGRTLRLSYAHPKKEKPAPPVQQQHKLFPTFNLFVANLPYDARAKDLKEFFMSEGCDIVSAEVVFHDNPRRSSGYGFVSFKKKKEADAALTTFNGKLFMGRPIRVAASRQFVKLQPKDGLPSDDTSAEINSGTEEEANTGNEN